MPKTGNDAFSRVMREVLNARANAVRVDGNRTHGHHSVPELRRNRMSVRKPMLPAAASAAVLAAAGVAVWFGGFNGATKLSAPPGASSDAAPNSAPCSNSQMAISVETLGSGMGTHVQAIIVRNDSSEPCTVQGAPGVKLQLASSSQTVSVEPDSSPSSEAPVVRLGPGQSGWAPLYSSAYSSGNPPAACGEGSSLLIALPNESRAAVVPAQVDSCDSYHVDVFRGGMPHPGGPIPTTTFTK